MNPNPDPFQIFSLLSEVNNAWLAHSSLLGAKMMAFNRGLQEVGLDALKHSLADEEMPLKAWSGDKSALMGIAKKNALNARKFHGEWSRWLRDMVNSAPQMAQDNRRRALFWTDQIINSLAPPNFFITNPGALQRFIRSDGKSLERGFQNWLDDFKRGDNLVTLVDETAFKVGENIAATPGAVVFQNELMELIQYAPSTASTHPTPLVLIQPWINKFYIFDLGSTNSFVKYLVEQGFTVFITSWKNPSADLRHITFDDYMLKGALQAIHVARDICGVSGVHAAGYCIGGTLLAALMAWLNQTCRHESDVPITDGTMFSTLTDFADPGNLDVFMHASAIKAIDALLEQDGFLDSKYIGLSFRLLNSASLIWRYVVNNYLFGETPPKSDMLYWNSDSTRLPQAMCSFYLREFYLRNKLIRPNGLKLGGLPIDLNSIRQPLYVVGAKQDHISPWRGTFRSFAFLPTSVRYVLASEGHITGIVNPPSARSKKKYWVSQVDSSMDADNWLALQDEQKGTWWTDWVQWLSESDDAKIEPPSLGSETFPILRPAPGVYVTE